MDRIKKARKASRIAFTRNLNVLQTEIAKDNAQLVDIQVHFAVLKDKASELEEYNSKLLDLMVEGNTAEAEMDAEILAADDYRTKYHQAKIKVISLVEAQQQRNVPQQQAPTFFQPQSSGQNDNRRGFKLPTIELKKFSGDVREWLQFWSQFKNIHEDTTMSKEDKFQYLIQTMVPDSRANELVNSYPPTADNYDKVIKSLKNRFGRNEILVEVYVRELLKLVLTNAMTPKEKVSLTTIYDKLETHIRSLESLGVTTDTCAAMLYPLVESSLPEELLRAWQRHTSTAVQFAPTQPGNITAAAVPAVSIVVTPKDRLANLMAFLQAEVDNEERIAIAVSGFGISNEQSARDKGIKKKSKSESSNETATAASLLSTKEGKVTDCIFRSENHETLQCEKAKNMSLEERQEMVKQKKACFNCLRTGHNRRVCKYNHKCAWCGKKHVLLMCREIVTNKSTSKKPGDETTKSQLESSLANLSLNTEVFLQTLSVKMRNRGAERIVRAVLDTGSHRSYVLGQTAKELGYEEVGRQNIIHLLFGGTKSEPKEHKGYCIRLSSLDDSYACNFVALDQETICHNISGIARGPWVQELSQKGIKLTDVGQKSEPISILIGADIIGKLLTGRIENLKCGATAIETRLGWIMMRKNSQGKSSRVDSALLAVSMFTQDANISHLWSLDVLGITDPVETKEAQQEQVKRQFRQTVKINNTERYEILLPWKENHPSLPDNKEMAIKRLETTTRKLKAENLFEEYCRVFQEWRADGIIEKIPPSEVNSHGYYLPHRHVVKENSTTHLRPVFDASARRRDSFSLNQCLEIGPNLIELIPTMILRFREKRIGTIHQRFLLGATIELHLQKELQKSNDEEHSKIIEKLKRSFYVDNCVTSVDTNNDLRSFKTVATATLFKGGFLLRGWEYSDSSLLNQNSSVLGLTWDKGNDTLSLSKTSLEEPFPEKVTKRHILSITQKIFDPIGLASPVLLRPKLLLQKLWSTKLDWDTEVSKGVRDDFRDWHGEVKLLRELRVDRWAFGDESRGDVTSFHVFVDPSRDAYAAALFARTETPNGVQVQLLEAKTRVTPLGKSTIPRLELLAATIGVRLMAFILEALEKSQADKYFWSDSTTVLAWIKRVNQWATFMWNRVKEIRQLSEPEQWNHVPGSMNPADLPSRGRSAKHLLESKWWEGPEWLNKPREQWPLTDYTIDEDEVNNEIKKVTLKSKKIESDIRLDLAMTSNIISFQDQRKYWYLKGPSKYSKILRMMAWMLRFIVKCRKVCSHQSRELTAKEMVEAELKLLSLSQEESFNGINDPRIKCLNPFKDKLGVLRLKTLVSSRIDQFGFRCPIVLDPRHPLISKLIYYRHVKLNHAGVQIVMNNLREQDWIISSRRVIHSVNTKCAICKRYKARRIEAPTAVLPEERIRDAAAFEVSGIDFAGPLYLKGGEKHGFASSHVRCIEPFT